MCTIIAYFVSISVLQPSYYCWFFFISQPQYQNSIKTLKAEIAALETDQEKLQSKQQQQQRRPLTSVTTTTSSSNASTTSGATGAGGAKSSFSAPTSAASSVDELRIKRELKEKSKLLEEKIKLLRAKEAEFGKISTQKTRLVGEVESMKKVVEDGKRRRAELQRKMRDEATMHRQESQQVKHSELQVVTSRCVKNDTFDVYTL